MENQEQWDWIAKLNALINFIMVNVIQVNIIRIILIYLFELKETKIAKFWKKKTYGANLWLNDSKYWHSKPWTTPLS